MLTRLYLNQNLAETTICGNCVVSVEYVYRHFFKCPRYESCRITLSQSKWNKLLFVKIYEKVLCFLLKPVSYYIFSLFFVCIFPIVWVLLSILNILLFQFVHFDLMQNSYNATAKFHSVYHTEKNIVWLTD